MGAAEENYISMTEEKIKKMENTVEQLEKMKEEISDNEDKTITKGIEKMRLTAIKNIDQKKKKLMEIKKGNKTLKEIIES